MIAASRVSQPAILLLSWFLSVLFLGSFVLVARSDYDHHPSAIRLPTDDGADDARVFNGDACGGDAPTAQPTSCPVKCFRPDPVCGVDGVTYWCGCADALCAGIRVAKRGYCEVGAAGTAPLPAQALLLIHIFWLILLAFFVLFGFF